jgi:riboflavin kinase/FMN adenylyltransferase
VINIGHRPTVDHSADAALSIEVHLLDFSADLYGSQLRVEFAQRLRSERKFSSTQELRSAIAADAAHVRKLTR